MAGTQVIFGQSDAVALYLVDALNAASAGNVFSLKLAARRLFFRAVDIGNIPKIGEPVDVQIIPMHEQSDREGADRYQDVYGVHLVFQQSVGAQAQDQMPWLMLLRDQVAEYLMSKAMAVTNAVHNFKGAHVNGVRHGKEGVYDETKLQKDGVFYSDTILTYRTQELTRH
jgi:hypothetical protein